MYFQTSPVDLTYFGPSGRVRRSTPAGLKELVYMVERPGSNVELMAHDDFEKLAGAPKE
jgi:hypothetical protein